MSGCLKPFVVRIISDQRMRLSGLLISPPDLPLLCRQQTVVGLFHRAQPRSVPWLSRKAGAGCRRAVSVLRVATVPLQVDRLLSQLSRQMLTGRGKKRLTHFLGGTGGTGGTAERKQAVQDGTGR
jgi:hypothetical protein